jgi:chromosome partitioning protein
MKVLACYSNKGGVGKTATAVNLAYAFAHSGARTLLCDLDPQGASSFYFRVKPSKKLKDAQFFQDVERFTRAIRGSDYENLDILPANLTFRDFDLFLARMKNSRSRLKKALKGVHSDYDVIILDCPPNISMLSEAVFKAADKVVVPVIPTTLSERSFVQLLDVFRADGVKMTKLLPFFSMVQGRKAMHGETITRLRARHGKRFLSTELPFSTDVEKMGLHRKPALCFAATRPAGKAYRALFDEVKARL